MEKAIELARLMAAEIDGSNELRAALKQEWRQLAGREPGSVFHDELSEAHSPVYFHEFAGHAGRHGLAYLGEAVPSDMLPPWPGAGAALAGLCGPDDRVAREQYLDFLRCRKFRCSLVCRRERAPGPEMKAENVEGMFLGCPAELTGDALDLRPDREQKFILRHGERTIRFSTGSSLAKAALAELGEAWPAGVEVATLSLRVYERLRREGVHRGGVPVAEAAAFRRLSLELFVNGIAEMRPRWPAVAARPGERPAVSRIVRRQLNAGTRCVNPFHGTVELEAEVRRLALLLDGEHDRDTLRVEIQRELGREIPAAVLDQALDGLARSGLLC
jgi:hypothetical protein